MNRIISIILMICILIMPVNAYADDIPMTTPHAQMSSVKKGDPVPYDGTLMNPAAVASIIAQINAEKIQGDIDVKRAVELAQAQGALELAKAQANLEYERSFASSQVKIRDDEIKRLVAAEKPNNHEWWMAGGFAAGLIITIGAAFVLSLARK